MGGGREEGERDGIRSVGEGGQHGDVSSVRGRRQRFTPMGSAGRPRPNITPSHRVHPEGAESEGNGEEAEGNERKHREQEDVPQSPSVNEPHSGSRVGPSLTDWNHVSDLVGAPGTFVFMHRGARRGAHAPPTRSDEKTRDVKITIGRNRAAPPPLGLRFRHGGLVKPREPVTCQHRPL